MHIKLGNAPVTAHHKMSRNCSEKWPCAICLCDNAEPDYLQLIKCKHKFHVDCIARWVDMTCVHVFKKVKRCPYCRTALTLEDEKNIKSLYQQSFKIS